MSVLPSLDCLLPEWNTLKSELTQRALRRGLAQLPARFHFRAPHFATFFTVSEIDCYSPWRDPLPLTIQRISRGHSTVCKKSVRQAVNLKQDPIGPLIRNQTKRRAKAPPPARSPPSTFPPPSASSTLPGNPATWRWSLQCWNNCAVFT
jgi:hypothetical protein